MLKELHRRRRIQAVNTVPNTFIGGVAATIPDKATLATKLRIAESDIGYFAVFTSDIEAVINANYSRVSFKSDTNITWFKDLDGHCLSVPDLQGCSSLTDLVVPQATSAGNYVVRFTKITDLQLPSLLQVGNPRIMMNMPELRYVNLESLTGFIYASGSSGYDFPFTDCPKLESVNIPSCTNIGDSPSYTGYFRWIKKGVHFTVNSFLATNNNGGEDGDIAWLRNTKNCTITYV